MKYTLSKIAGVIIGAFGVLVILVFLANLGMNGYSSEDMSVFVAFGVIPATLGFLLTRWSAKGQRNSDLKGHEQIALEQAKMLNGKITAVQLATNTKLSLEEANQILQKLQLDGYAHLSHSEHGAIIYEFTEFLEGKSH